MVRHIKRNCDFLCVAKMGLDCPQSLEGQRQRHGGPRLESAGQSCTVKTNLEEFCGALHIKTANNTSTEVKKKSPKQDR